MTGGTVQFCLHFFWILRIHLVHYRMASDRVSQSILDRDDGHLREVVLRQLHLAVEDRNHVLGFELLRLGIRSVALQAERVRIRGS